MITDIRLSISEASKLFGISQRTIRRAIAAGELEFTLVQGRYKISFDSLLRWSQTSTLTVHKRDTQGIGQYVSAWKISAAPIAVPAQIATADAVPTATPRTVPMRAKKVPTTSRTSHLATSVAASAASTAANVVPSTPSTPSAAVKNVPTPIAPEELILNWD